MIVIDSFSFAVPPREHPAGLKYHFPVLIGDPNRDGNENSDRKIERQRSARELGRRTWTIEGLGELVRGAASYMGEGDAGWVSAGRTRSGRP
jgi:hypothetical protein